MTKQGYLTDKELEMLIAHTEENDLVEAPPQLLEDILAYASWGEEKSLPEPGVQETSERIVLPYKPPEALSKKQKTAHFRLYCARVIITVAAAVALVFILPKTSVVSRERTEAPSRESVLAGESVTREEVLSGRRNSSVFAFGSIRLIEDIRQLELFE